MKIESVDTTGMNDRTRAACLEQFGIITILFDAKGKRIKLW